MQSIKELIKSHSPPKKKIEKSERAEIIKNIYDLYISPNQNKLRKIENWKRYVKNCKENGLNIKDPKNVNKFTKNKLFIKVIPIRAFCFKLSHIKTPDLWYCLSEAKDRNRRELSIAKFLL